MRELSGRTPDSQSREPVFQSPLLLFQSLGIFVLTPWPQLTQLCKWVPGYRLWKCKWLVVARNFCMARILPGEAELVSEWTGLSERAKSVSTLSDPTDWIMCYIKIYLFTFYNLVAFISVLARDEEYDLAPGTHPEERRQRGFVLLVRPATALAEGGRSP